MAALGSARQPAFVFGQAVVGRREFAIIVAQGRLWRFFRQGSIPVGNFPMPFGFLDKVHDAHPPSSLDIKRAQDVGLA